MNEMIENVLLLCPGCDREAVKNDLNITGDLERTLNHALDGMLSPRTGNQVSESSPANASQAAITIMDNDNIIMQPSKFTRIKERTNTNTTNIDNSSSIYANINNVTSNTLEGSEPLIFNGISNGIKRGQCEFMELSDSDDDSNVYIKKCDKTMDYLSTNTTKHCRKHCSDSDESLPVAFEKEECHLGKTSNNSNRYNLQDDNLSQNRQDVLIIDDNKQEGITENVKKRKKRSKEEIEEQKKLAALKKQAREKERNEKLEEKKRQKEEKAEAAKQKKMAVEKEKLNKKADKLTKSTLTLANCIKFVTVSLDNRLFVASSSEVIENNIIIQKLVGIEANYKIEEQFYPRVVTWQRINVEHSVRDKEMMYITSSNTYTDENQVLVVIEAKQFAEMVHSFKLKYNEDSRVTHTEKTLVDFVQDLKILYPAKNITLLTSGLEKYMRTVKTKQHRVFRDVATGLTDDNEVNKKRRKQKLDSTVNITRTDIEEALIDLQIKTNVCVYPCETDEDIATKIASFTKAVAEKPYKKSVMEGFEFCLDRMDKTSLKVSKDGHGMICVWQQQIEQFRNVSKDMASAIVMQYPSPQLLMKAYKNCCSEREALLLLEDIVVRRGGGSLATSRRIGPELSKRFYILFHSRNNAELMKKL